MSIKQYMTLAQSVSKCSLEVFILNFVVYKNYLH